MSRLLSIAVLLLVAVSARATDGNWRNPEQITLATTARIVKIDFKSRTLKVRGSDGQQVRNLPDLKQSFRQKIGVTLPGGITIALPSIITGRNSSKTASPAANEQNNLDEYIVVVTRDTAIQDGADTIRLEDFKAGETISIHGVLSGTTLTASRIAKWS
jgi:hypothetical protein